MLALRRFRFRHDCQRHLNETFKHAHWYIRLAIQLHHEVVSFEVEFYSRVVLRNADPWV
jgi:hypothetical protein